MPVSGVLTVRDGVCVAVREIRAEDAEALRRLVGRSSERSIELRFFGPMQELSEEKARRFAEVDGKDRFELVALDPEDEDEIVAVVRYEREGNTDGAEYAALVEDRFQGRGLGIGLTRRLIEAAQERGIKRRTRSSCARTAGCCAYSVAWSSPSASVGRTVSSTSR